ncbi:MAG: PilZ domain-containing protein [Verrucomicrobiae bacterium]|nr:PilZ domain-containing protein [Verrucomicrobiae bacterium]
MAALDEAGYGVSRYHVENGFRDRLSLALEEAEMVLLKAFADDVKTAAINCINLSSCLNAVGFSRRFNFPPEITEFAPNFPHSFATVKSSALAGHLTPSVRSGLNGFVYYLRSMREALDALLALETARGGVTSADIAQARDATYTASCFAKLTLKDLISIEGRLADAYEVAHMSYLTRLLDEVLEGKSPLLANGHLERAKTEFLVRERRVQINAEASVADPARRELVIVQNISQGGLAFKSSSAYHAGQRIRVRLTTSGRELLGRIVWRMGTRAGVTFFYPLEANDDLLLAV